MARESVISQRIKFLIAPFPANSKKKSESDPAGEKSSKLSMGACLTCRSPRQKEIVPTVESRLMITTSLNQ